MIPASQRSLQRDLMKPLSKQTFPLGLALVLVLGGLGTWLLLRPTALGDGFAVGI